MQLALRRGFGYAYPPRGIYGLGDDGAVATVTNSDPIATDSDPLITDESGNVCLASMFVSGQCPQSAFGPNPYPTTGPVTPAPQLTPAELGAEQARASAWLATIPGAVSAAGRVVSALTTAQITAGLQAGALKPSSTCPSGYLVSGSGQCVGTASPSIVSGVSNTTLGFAAAAFILFLFFMGRSR